MSPLNLSPNESPKQSLAFQASILQKLSSSMGDQENINPRELPEVVVVEPAPPFFKYHEDEISRKFHLIKSWDYSSLSQEEFLTTYARSVRAMLCSGSTKVSSNLLRLVPSLRFLITDSAGLNHIDLAECHRLGIAVANAGDVYSEDGAVMTVGLLIDVMRKISAADRYVRQGHWSRHYPLGSKLRGKRVGIVGLGSIGMEIANKLEVFGCKISYTSRTSKPSAPFPFFPTATDLATNSDILVVCCSLTEQTRHIIDVRVLDALGNEGVVINIGRGPLVDEKEMVRRLVGGELKGAGLDVFENEPEVPKELFGLDNVVLSPHRAVFTEESYRDLCELVVGNLEAFFSNKPLISAVNLVRWSQK